MRRKFLFILLAGVIAVSIGIGAGAARTKRDSAPAQQSLQDKVVGKERQGLEALKDGKVQEFAELTADEAVFLDDHGSATKAEVVQHVGNFKLIDFSMDEIKFVPLSDRAGVVAYKLTEKGSSHGREFNAVVYASAVWTERNGKWLCLFSQETPAKQK